MLFFSSCDDYIFANDKICEFLFLERDTGKVCELYIGDYDRNDKGYRRTKKYLWKKNIDVKRKEKEIWDVPKGNGCGPVYAFFWSWIRSRMRMWLSHVCVSTDLKIRRVLVAFFCVSVRPSFRVMWRLYVCMFCLVCDFRASVSVHVFFICRIL